MHARTHAHNNFTALLDFVRDHPGEPVLEKQNHKGKTSLDLLEQEIVSGCGICWAICKCAPHPRHITMPACHHSVFTGRMPFLPPNQQHQSTEGKGYWDIVIYYFSRWRPFAVLDFWNAFCDHVRRILGGLYQWAKFGWITTVVLIIQKFGYFAVQDTASMCIILFEGQCTHLC